MNNTTWPGSSGLAAAAPPGPAPPALAPSDSSAQPPETPASSAPLARQPGKTPHACRAFLACYRLGQGLSLAALARSLGENPGAVSRLRDLK